MHQYSRLSLSAASASASALEPARLIGAKKKKKKKMKKSADGKGNLTEQVQGQVNIPFGERDRILLVGEGMCIFNIDISYLPTYLHTASY
jgi:hypothetical protein